MIYLLAKYTLLFLLTSILGFALGYWWSRRSFVDVSESFESLRKSSERSDRGDWSRLWNRLDAIPEPKEPDLSDMTARLDNVVQTVSRIPKPIETDLSGVNARIDKLSQSVAAIPKPTEPDLSDVNSRIDRLSQSIAAIPKPTEPDLTDVNSGIEKLGNTVAAIPKPTTPDFSIVNSRLDELTQSVASIPIPAPQKDVDLSPLQREIDEVKRSISAIPVIETHEPADLSPLSARLAAVESALESMPEPERVNLAPLHSRLDSIDDEVRKLGMRLQERPEPKLEPARHQSGNEPVILSAALYGDKDDLKQISGVGPQLEGLLNKNGVYYFWQVASWNKEDIDFIDDRLDVFRGRISRDDWVAQANRLKEDPAAARMPAG